MSGVDAHAYASEVIVKANDKVAAAIKEAIANLKNDRVAASLLAYNDPYAGFAISRIDMMLDQLEETLGWYDYE
jgi:hypothetical protein